MLLKTWRLSPHPDLAAAYAYARPGDSPRDRLNRMRHLARLTPHDSEGPIALAITAIEAREWDEARNALEPLLEGRLTQRVATLMARIEGEQHGHTGRVREWLARAVNAPRDPAWTADGVVSDRWAPVSPVTGALDAFRWRVPVEAVERRQARCWPPRSRRWSAWAAGPASSQLTANRRCAATNPCRRPPIATRTASTAPEGPSRPAARKSPAIEPPAPAAVAAAATEQPHQPGHGATPDTRAGARHCAPNSVRPKRARRGRAPSAARAPSRRTQDFCAATGTRRSRPGRGGGRGGAGARSAPFGRQGIKPGRGCGPGVCTAAEELQRRPCQWSSSMR